MLLKKICLFIIFSPLFSSIIQAQTLVKALNLQTEIDSVTQQYVYAGLDSLFFQIENEKLSNQLVAVENEKLNISILSTFKGINNDKFRHLRKELINFYRIEKGKYAMDIAFYAYSLLEDRTVLSKVIHLIGEEHYEGIRFSIPLNYLTKEWTVQKVGLSQYVYKAKLDIKNAELFDARNKAIAQKLELTPEGFDFYMCANYQEILSLLGIKYDIEENGTIENGYGVAEGAIFAIQGNEDFSHDIVHYYSGKIHSWKKNRNWLAEEGIAYYWGNAYYVDSSRNMIEQNHMIPALHKYLIKNPQVNLLTLFDENPSIFPQLSSKISVRTCISGLICAEIEDKKGIEGVLSMITCGNYRRDYGNFFKKTDELIMLNRENFNQEVQELIAQHLESLKN